MFGLERNTERLVNAKRQNHIF